MATRWFRGFALLHAALISTTALTIAGPAWSQSKVGVTSAADGDPLGKPPADAERVLKIGIDVQANEVVTTRANDRAHLVFLDGSSLTVGPNARLTIDKFVFDPNSKTGELAITASQGVFRLVGGKISKTNPITIGTPSGTIGIRGGITMFGVNSNSTTADFIFGKDMTVTGQGQTQTATRPGSQIIVNFGASPGLPSMLPPGGLAALISQLENGGKNSNNSANGGDQKAKSSGFSDSNSGQNQPGTNVNPGGLPPNTNNNALTNSVNNNNGATNPTVQPAAQTSPSGPAKTTQTLTGYVGGLLVAGISGGEDRRPLSITVPISGARPGDLTINTNADTSTVTSTIVIRSRFGEITSPSATLQLGTPPNGASFFQDNVNFVTGTVDGQATIRVGEATFTARNTSTLLTSAQVPGGSNVGVGCNACDFLTFGEWETVITPGRSGRLSQASAVVMQAPWVAGQAATQLPNTQSASFSGGMWGQAQNAGGSIRNVQGTYGMTYNWGSSLGSFNASFDNRNYAGGVQGAGGANFTGVFAGGNRIGTLSGAFNTSPTAGGAVVGQSGQFGIAGPGYLASGVFAGSKQ